jgi:hypothetical protein
MIEVEQLPQITPNEGANLVAKFNRAKRIKDMWASKFEECYEYALPQRESFYAEAQGQVRTDKIFDETAVVGVQEFASRLQAGLVPNFARWAELVSGSEIPADQRSEVDKALEIVTNYVFEIIQNSNFSQEIHENFLDLAVGTACLSVTEGDALNPVMFTALPLSQLYLDTGPDDMIDHIFRERPLRASNIKYAYPKATLPEEVARNLSTGKDEMIKLVDCTYRIFGSMEEETRRCVFDPKTSEIYFKESYKGTGSNPFISFRWSKAAGEVWGRGPLMNAMPAIKTCNLTMQLILENAQMSISGIYTMEDDGIVNPDTIQLLPGTLIPVAAGSSGLKSISPAGNFDVAQLVLNDMRMNIRKALYNDMLGNPDKTPMSATEVSQRMADLSRQIGAAFGRLQSEMVNPVLRRVVYILKKQGRIQVPSVNGREVKVRSTSPLAQGQAQQDIVAFDHFVSLVQQRFGPQIVNLLVKSEDAAKYLADKFSVPERLLRSDGERAKLVAQLTQQMGAMNGQQQQQQPEQPPQGAAGGGM